MLSRAPRRRFATFLPGILAASVLAGCTLQQNVASFQPSGREGTAAPALSGQALDGTGTVSLDFQGQKTIVIFWASWCGPCRHEQPELNQVAADLAPLGIRFFGVNFLDHDRASAKAFVQEFGVAYPNLYDPSGRLAARYQVDAPPAKVLVDGRGIIVGRIPGEISERQLRAAIQEKFG